MVRQYIQKLLARKSSPNTSLMRLFSISSRVAMKTLSMSFCAALLSVNLPMSGAGLPCSMVARCREKLGSSLFSQ